MRRKVFALVVGSDFRHLLFWWAVRCGRRMKTLSIFVDESGRFQHPDADSRFYILGLVFHDQSHDISRIVADLERSELELGLEGHCFHAGPLIRKEKGYEIMSRRFRGRILSRMMAFADRIDFKYHCLSVDKKFIDNAGQIVEHLRHSLQLFIDANRAMLTAIDKVKVYYDCGQSPVTNLLHGTFAEALGKSVEFKQNVRPLQYRLFQIADLVCTLRLIELRLAHGMSMTQSEMRFFGGPRDFKRNVLKKIKRKEI